MNCFKNIVFHSVKNKKNLVIVIILSIIKSFVYTLRSYLIGKITETRDLNYFYKYTAAILFCYVILSIMYYLVNNDSKNFNKNLFVKYISNLFSSNFKELKKYNEYVLSDLNDSLDNFGYITRNVYTHFLNRFTSSIIGMGVITYYNKKVGLVLIGTSIIIVFIQKYLIKLLERNWNIYYKDYIKFNQLFQSIMLNIWNIKYNSLEILMNEQLKSQYNKRSELLYKYNMIKSVVSEIPGFLYYIAIFYNLYSIIVDKNIKIGIAVFLILQLYKIGRNLYAVCITSVDLFDNVKNIEKICPTWLLKPKPSRGNKINRIDNLVFNNVNFSYNKVNVLDNFSFNVKKGDIVSLQGKSGSGKSTIINLMCRLYDTDDNSILINNNCIKNIDIVSLREQITVVPQTVITFDMSIKDNIVLDSKYDKKKLDFLVNLLKLPNINKNAKKLSYGQKQRVLIARSLYRDNKSLYIFDEYLSAVDSKTAEKIHKYVIDYLKKNNKIGIFISHNQQRSKYSNKFIKL